MSRIDAVIGTDVPAPTPSPAFPLDQVQPVMLTCARDLELVAECVDSYATHVASAMPRPVLVVDLTTSRRLPPVYLNLLHRMVPAAVHVHPHPTGMTDRESVNDAAFFALACALEESVAAKYVLFLEDDIAFSSHTVGYLHQLELPANAGFVTLYQPSSGYGGREIEPFRFYGTQCLLFPRAAVEVILENRSEMERRFAPNYDMRWAQYLGARGYRLYAAPKSYVQHIGRVSRLGGNFHSADTFEL